MVLSNAEFQAAANCKTRKNKKARMLSLYILRQNTSSFLIQCLADREIQTLIYLHENPASKSAYHYNCARVHAPHACAHLVAVDGNGWDEGEKRPYDPKLTVRCIVAKQHSHRTSTNGADVAGNSGELRQQKIDQLEANIRILQEENAKMKQNYSIYLKQLSDNKVKLDSQKVNLLEQKIQTLNSDLQSQAWDSSLLREENSKLKIMIKNLESESISKKKVNVPDSRRIDDLEHQLNTMRLDLQDKNELINSLKERNASLQTAFRETQTQLHFSRLSPRSSRTNDEHSQGCCIIM